MLGLRTVAALAGVALIVPIGAAAQAAAPLPSLVAEPASYVNPFIGCMPPGNTVPGCGHAVLYADV